MISTWCFQRYPINTCYAAISKMLAMRRMRILISRLKVSPSCAVRCHTHFSSSASASASPTIHTVSSSVSRPSDSDSVKKSLPNTTPDTLIHLAMKKDVSGILLELENMHNSSCSQESSDEAESSREYESELAILAANLFFNEKVTTADVTSIEQCCDIFDLLDGPHPVLAQQGYSKLLELSLSKDRLQLVCCLCKRLLAQDIRLEKALCDSLLTYLTGCGQIEQALALARTVPLSRQIILALVEPLFLSHQYMEFASLFRQYCLPFNNDTSLTDVNLVVISMIWAKGISPPLLEADREEFVASIVRSLDAYRAIFHDMASKDPHYSRVAVNKLFRVMQEAVQYVFLSSNEGCEVEEEAEDEDDDGEAAALREDTASVVSELRRKFVTSLYFSPFPFMPQDSTTATNFSPKIQDITAQVADTPLGNRKQQQKQELQEQEQVGKVDTLAISVSASVSAAESVLGEEEGERKGRSSFFLSNYLWQQDYADVINSLVEDREDDGPYYDDSEDDDSDSDEDDEDLGEYASTVSDSEDDSSSDEEETEYSINLKLKLPHPSSSFSSSSDQAVNKVHKRIDMGAHLTRSRDDLPHYSPQHQHTHDETRVEAMKSFMAGFQVYKVAGGQNLSLYEFLGGAGAGSEHMADMRSPEKVALCEKMDTLGYVDEDFVEEAMASLRLRLENSAGGAGGAGGTGGAGAGVSDISRQCHGASNLRLGSDLFGYVPPHHYAENAYDAIKFMKDDVNWGPWKRY